MEARSLLVCNEGQATVSSSKVPTHGSREEQIQLNLTSLRSINKRIPMIEVEAMDNLNVGTCSSVQLEDLLGFNIVRHTAIIIDATNK